MARRKPTPAQAATAEAAVASFTAGERQRAKPVGLKPRGDNKLFKFTTPEQRAEIIQWWRLENLGYAKCLERMKAQWGITALDQGDLCWLWQNEGRAIITAHRHGNADEMERLLRHDGRFGEMAIARAREIAFGALDCPAPDLTTAKIMLKIIGDSEKLGQKERELSFSREKYEQTLRDEEETAIRALAASVKENPVALEHFHKFRDALRAARAKAAA